MDDLTSGYNDDNRIINMGADEFHNGFFKPDFITSLRGCGHINPDGYSGKTGGNQISAKWMQGP
jgi:hypothetical protein